MWAFVALALLFASGCAQKDWIDRTLVTENVSGSWQGVMGGLPVGGSAQVWLTLKQEGNKVSGEFRTVPRLASWFTAEGALEGTMAGDVLRLNDTRKTLTGELTVSGDEMRGQLGRYPATFHTVESSSASSPPR